TLVVDAAASVSCISIRDGQSVDGDGFIAVNGEDSETRGGRVTLHRQHIAARTADGDVIGEIGQRAFQLDRARDAERDDVYACVKVGTDDSLAQGSCAAARGRVHAAVITGVGDGERRRGNNLTTGRFLRE